MILLMRIVEILLREKSIWGCLYK